MDDALPDLLPEDFALLLSNLQTVLVFGFEAADCGIVSLLCRVVSADALVQLFQYFKHLGTHRGLERNGEEKSSIPQPRLAECPFLPLNH